LGSLLFTVGGERWVGGEACGCGHGGVVGDCVWVYRPGHAHLVSD